MLDGTGLQSTGRAERAPRLTERRALALPTPERGYSIHWCPTTPGFGVRVTAAGARSWIAERRVEGKTKRRTLGAAEGRGAISADAARRLMIEVSSELQRGIDRLEERRADRAEQRTAVAADALTLQAALREYVTGKRRGKDGLALKERTRADYLAMLEAGGLSAQTGRDRQAGELAAIAHKPLTRITANDVREVHRVALARGARRASYSMQVLRAVLNWHGVKVPDNPLGRDVAGRHRIVLGKTAGDPKPIQPERLSAWWNTATSLAGREAVDFYRLMLLTGARTGELRSVCVRDVDARGGRVVLRDTKNRSDHTLLLSRQAAEIVRKYAVGKKPAAALFDVGDARKALTAINLAAGTDIRPHGLRSTFASVAEELVSAYTLKRMLNHAEAGDVTGAHYVGKSETQLRAGWQAVADFITTAPQ